MVMGINFVLYALALGFLLWCLVSREELSLRGELSVKRFFFYASLALLLFWQWGVGLITTLMWCFKQLS